MNTYLFASVENTWLLAGWTMLHFLWLGTLFALAALPVRWLLRRASANVRYVTALACLATLAALPVAIAAWLHAYSPPVQSIALRMQTNDASQFATTGQVPATDLKRIEPIEFNPPLSAQNSQTVSIAQPAPLRAQSTDIMIADPTPATAAPTTTDAFALAIVTINMSVRYLPWVWLIGTPITFALTATGLLGTRRLRRASRPIADGPIIETLEKLAASLRLTRRVAVCVCDRIPAPVLIGILRPIILLPPAALTGYSADEIEMVLLHELAHVRRWDNLVNLIQRLIESILFFHPAVWLISNWVRHERESCCDSLVVTRTDRPHAYAELLVALAAQMPRSVLFHPAASSAMAAGPLRSRIRRILKLDDDPMLISGKSFTLVLGLLLIAGTLAALYLPKIGHADETAAKATESDAFEKPSKGPKSADAKDLLKRFDIDPDKELSSNDASNMAQLFSPGFTNPVESRSYSIPSDQQKLLRATFDSLRNSPLNKHIQFKEKWDEKRAHIEITAPKLALDGFFDPLVHALGSPLSISKPADDVPLCFALRRGKLRRTEIYLNEQLIDEDAIRALLRGRSKTIDDQPISLTADKLISYADVMKVIDLLESLGVKKLALDTRSRDAREAHFKSSFVLRDDNPIQTRTHQVDPSLYRSVSATFEGWQKDPFGPQLKFDAKWNADHSTVEITAPKAAQDLFAIELKAGDPRAIRAYATANENSATFHGFEQALKDKIPLVVVLFNDSGEYYSQLQKIYNDTVQQTKSIYLYGIELDPISAEGKRYGVKSAPTCIIFIDGREASRIDGTGSPGRLLNIVRNAIESINSRAARTGIELVAEKANRSKFPSLEEQKLADLAWKRLGLELEPIGEADLKRVKAFGYDGGLRVSGLPGTVAKSGADPSSASIVTGDILVGLHVWPTTNMTELVRTLNRDDLDELNPLKFYVIHNKQTGPPSADRPNEATRHDVVHTGRLSVKLPTSGFGAGGNFPSRSDRFYKPASQSPSESDSPTESSKASKVARTDKAQSNIAPSPAPALVSNPAQPATSKSDTKATAPVITGTGTITDKAKYHAGNLAFTPGSPAPAGGSKDAKVTPVETVFVAYDIPRELKGYVQQYFSKTAVRNMADDRGRYIVQASQNWHDQFAALLKATPKWRDPAAAKERAAAPVVMKKVDGEDILEWRSVGMSLKPIQDDPLPLKGKTGVAVSEVSPGSPAAWADMRPGDILTDVGNFNAGAILEVQSLLKALGEGLQSKTTVSVTFFRPSRGSHVRADFALGPEDLGGKPAEPQNSQPSADTKTGPASVKKSHFRYDGKSFETWRTSWQSELSTEKRIEAVKALAAFGANGFGREAAVSILDVADQYDWVTAIRADGVRSREPEGKLQKAVFAALVGGPGAVRIDAKHWLPLVRQRYEADPAKWQQFAIQILANCARDNENESADIEAFLLLLAQSQDEAVSETAIDALVAYFPGSDELRKRLSDQLKKKDRWLSAVKSFGRTREFPPEVVDVFLHGDPERQTALRKLFYVQMPPGDAQRALVAKLTDILKDDSKAADHLATIRALGALARNQKVADNKAQDLLIEIAHKGRREHQVAAACALQLMTMGKIQAVRVLGGTRNISDEKLSSAQLQELVTKEQETVIGRVP